MGSGEITNFGIMGGGLSVECHRVESWGSSDKVVTGHCSEPGEEERLKVTTCCAWQRRLGRCMSGLLGSRN